MSVCNDERWKTPDWTPGWVHECPCYSEERMVFCGLGVFEMFDEYNAEGKPQDFRPDSCPLAPILHALPTATGEQLKVCEAVLKGNILADVPGRKGFDSWVVFRKRPDTCNGTEREGE